MTYSYHPSQLCGGGRDQLRFELGDTAVDGGAQTCALADEEYDALLEAHADRGLRQVKCRCVEAIVAKLSYEVDTAVGGMRLDLSRRYDRWNALLRQLQAGAQTPSANARALGGHYFSGGMHENPRARWEE